MPKLNKYLKISLIHFGLAITIIAIIIIVGCAHWEIRCSDMAIVCAKTAQDNGKIAKIAYGKYLGRGYPVGTEHAQAYYLDGNKKVWMQIEGGEVQAGIAQHHFQVDNEITWEDAIKIWWGVK